MILIKDADFEMEQVKNLPFFDLSMLVKINEGKENERTEMKLVAYAMPFEQCIKEIISHRLCQPDKEYTIAQYIHDYEEEVNKICSLIHYVESISKKKKKAEDEEEHDELVEE